MGTANVLTNEYMRDNTRFADVINYHVFHGKQAVRPQDLEELDTKEDIIIEDAEGKIILTAEHIRDLLKYTPIKMTENPRCVYMILGIENQTASSFFAPVAGMIYDGLDYWRQRNRMWKDHIENSETVHISIGERFSRFLKSDRLVPVVTTYVYWGVTPWEGAVCLHDMFADGYPKQVLDKVPNHFINLVAPEQIQDYASFKTEFGQAMQLIAAKYDKNKLVEIITDVSGRFGSVSKESIQLVNQLAGYKLPIQKEGTNVKDALQELAEEMNQDLIREKDRLISEKDSQLSEKDFQIRKKDSQLSEKDFQISEKDSLLSEKESQIGKLRKEIVSMAQEISTLKDKLHMAGLA